MGLKMLSKVSHQPVQAWKDQEMSIFFVYLSCIRLSPQTKMQIKTHPVVINGCFSHLSFIIFLWVPLCPVVLLRSQRWNPQAQCWVELPLQVPVIPPASYLFTQRGACQHYSFFQISYSKQNTEQMIVMFCFFSRRGWGSICRTHHCCLCQ